MQSCFWGTARDTQKSELPFSNTPAATSKFVPHGVHNSSITTQLKDVWLTLGFLWLWCWLVFISLTRLESHGKREPHLRDYLHQIALWACLSVAHFLDSWLMWKSPDHCVGGAPPGQVVLGCLENQDGEDLVNKSVSSIPPWSLLHFGLWVFPLTSLRDGLWPGQCEMKQTLSSLSGFWWGFYQSNRKQTDLN